MKREVVKGDVLIVTKGFNDDFTKGETVSILEVKEDALTLVVNDWYVQKPFDVNINTVNDHFEIFTEGYKVKNFIHSYLDDEGYVIDNKDSIYDLCDLINAANEKFNCKIEAKYLGGYYLDGQSAAYYVLAGIVNGELYFDII